MSLRVMKTRIRTKRFPENKERLFFYKNSTPVSQSIDYTTGEFLLVPNLLTSRKIEDAFKKMHVAKCVLKMHLNACNMHFLNAL